MPESLYGERDNPGQRTLAQHVFHAAVANAQAVDRFIDGLAFAGRTVPTWQFCDELNEHTYWTLGEVVGNFRAAGMAPPAFRFFAP